MHLRIGVDKGQDLAACSAGTGVANGRNDALCLSETTRHPRAAATSAVRSVDTLSATITSMASAWPYVPSRNVDRIEQARQQPLFVVGGDDDRKAWKHVRLCHRATCAARSGRQRVRRPLPAPTRHRRTLRSSGRCTDWITGSAGTSLNPVVQVSAVPQQHVGGGESVAQKIRTLGELIGQRQRIVVS